MGRMSDHAINEMNLHEQKARKEALRREREERQRWIIADQIVYCRKRAKGNGHTAKMFEHIANELEAGQPLTRIEIEFLNGGY